MQSFLVGILVFAVACLLWTMLRNALEEINSNEGSDEQGGRALGKTIVIVGIVVVALVFALIASCSSMYPSSDSDSSTDSESESSRSSSSSHSGSSSSSSDSSSSSSYSGERHSGSSGFVDDEDTLGVELDDGSTVYQDGDGNYYYTNPDGSVEVTDGWGNVGIDSDLDGEFDSYSTDGGETWQDWDY